MCKLCGNQYPLQRPEQLREHWPGMNLCTVLRSQFHPYGLAEVDKTSNPGHEAAVG